MDRTALRQTVMDYLMEEKGSYPEGLDDDLSLRESLGLDSIDVVNLAVTVQSQFSIEFRGNELERIVSVGDLLDLLQVKLDSTLCAA